MKPETIKQCKVLHRCSYPKSTSLCTQFCLISIRISPCPCPTLIITAQPVQNTFLESIQKIDSSSSEEDSGRIVSLLLQAAQDKSHCFHICSPLPSITVTGKWHVQIRNGISSPLNTALLTSIECQGIYVLCSRKKNSGCQIVVNSTLFHMEKPTVHSSICVSFLVS